MLSRGRLGEDGSGGVLKGRQFFFEAAVYICFYKQTVLINPLRVEEPLRMFQRRVAVLREIFELHWEFKC